MDRKEMTIQDIAFMSGVSKATVSRYLNGKYDCMGDVTRERIKAVIDSVGYRPNRLARGLKQRRSFLVGLVIADIESPFSSAAIKSVGDAMRTAAYHVIIGNSDNDSQKEQALIRSMLSQQVDGLIVNTTERKNPHLIQLANSGVPLVLLDRFVDDYLFDIAYIANREPIFTAIEHLKEQGYGPIAYFTQPYERVSPRRLRREAFLEKLELMHVAHPERLIHAVDITDMDSVVGAVAALLRLSGGRSSPPAIITSNGLTLLHVVKALRKLGASMPGDIGVCGYDDWGWMPQLEWAGLLDVGITTLTASVHDLGQAAAEAMLARIQDETAEKQRREIPALLCPRASTKLKGR